jgi:hypothetical protein
MSQHAGAPELSSDERRTLACVLDEIVPPSGDGRLPGAGELGVVAWIEAALVRSPELRPVLAQGLAALDAAARLRGARGFATLARADRAPLLRETAAAQPAFLPGLVVQTYIGYYGSPQVQRALGLEARPPFPQGYEVPPTDFALLDRVRRRARMYRDA